MPVVPQPVFGQVRDTSTDGFGALWTTMANTVQELFLLVPAPPVGMTLEDVTARAVELSNIIGDRDVSHIVCGTEEGGMPRATADTMASVLGVRAPVATFSGLNNFILPPGSSNATNDAIRSVHDAVDRVISLYDKGIYQGRRNLEKGRLTERGKGAQGVER